jgi:hypothetical protein
MCTRTNLIIERHATGNERLELVEEDDGNVSVQCPIWSAAFQLAGAIRQSLKKKPIQFLSQRLFAHSSFVIDRHWKL